jgi:hypothetical protein
MVERHPARCLGVDVLEEEVEYLRTQGYEIFTQSPLPEKFRPKTFRTRLFLTLGSLLVRMGVAPLLFAKSTIYEFVRV